MLGRKRGMNPRDVVLANVAALAINDRDTINRLDPEFSRLTAEQIFGALGDFGQMIKPALKPEQRESMREAIQQEIKSQPLSTGSRSAAVAISNALLVDADPRKAAKEIASHAGVLQTDVMQVAQGCILAAANVVIKLGIKLNFK